jgi:hypothetical protein
MITGDGVLDQVHDHVVSAVFVSVIVTAASFAPSAFGKAYGGDPGTFTPKSERWTAEAEMLNGRVAMLALAVSAVVEIMAM